MVHKVSEYFRKSCIGNKFLFYNSYCRWNIEFVPFDCNFVCFRQKGMISPENYPIFHKIIGKINFQGHKSEKKKQFSKISLPILIAAFFSNSILDLRKFPIQFYPIEMTAFGWFRDISVRFWRGLFSIEANEVFR